MRELLIVTALNRNNERFKHKANQKGVQEVKDRPHGHSSDRRIRDVFVQCAINIHLVRRLERKVRAKRRHPII